MDRLKRWVIRIMRTIGAFIRRYNDEAYGEWDR